MTRKKLTQKVANISSGKAFVCKVSCFKEDSTLFKLKHSRKFYFVFTVLKWTTNIFNALQSRLQKKPCDSMTANSPFFLNLSFLSASEDENKSQACCQHYAMFSCHWKLLETFQKNLCTSVTLDKTILSKKVVETWAFWRHGIPQRGHNHSKPDFQQFCATNSNPKRICQSKFVPRIVLILVCGDIDASQHSKKMATFVSVFKLEHQSVFLLTRNFTVFRNHTKSGWWTLNLQINFYHYFLI